MPVIPATITPLERAIRSAESQLRTLRVEETRVIDPLTIQEVERVRGTRNKSPLPISAYNRIVVHNHPRGENPVLSHYDVAGAARVNVLQIRAAGWLNGKPYLSVMTRGKMHRAWPALLGTLDDKVIEPMFQAYLRYLKMGRLEATWRALLPLAGGSYPDTIAYEGLYVPLAVD